MRPPTGPKEGSLHGFQLLQPPRGDEQLAKITVLERVVGAPKTCTPPQASQR